MTMTLGSLFSGIGGFDCGFERAGFKVRWQVENDDYCNKVLAKHWPNVKRYGDIRDVQGSELEPVDCICGGFPCTDLSYAGKGEGIHAERSGLWFDMLRVVRMVRPSYVVVENVPALLNRGMGAVVGGLAESGYDCEWDCIPACAVGAPHIRDRIWIVAYSDGQGLEGRNGTVVPERAGQLAAGQSGSLLADTEVVTKRPGLCTGEPSEQRRGRLGNGGGPTGEWESEPAVGRVADGVPARVDRLRGLGNAVVPQVAEWIARRILAAEAER